MVEGKKVSFYTNLIYFVVVIGFVIIRICANLGLFQFMGAYGSYYMSLITQIGLIFLLPLILFKILNKSTVKNTFKFFSYKKVSFKTIILSIILGAVVFFLNVYVSNFFNSIIALFGYKHTPATSALPATWWVLLLNLLCTAVLPAICEETLHRGMLLKGNSSFGMKKSILISGLLFGLLHLNIEQFFYASIIGFFLGYLCWCCSSIYPCMIVHFMNNGISVFLSFASAKGWAIGNIFTNISKFLLQNPVLGFVMFILVLGLLVWIGFELTRLLVKDSFNYNFGKRQKELTSMAIRESYFQQIEDIKTSSVHKPIYSAKDNMIVIEANEFLDFINKNANKIFPKTDFQKPKMDTKTKIFLIGSVVLSAAITIMTFIWGLL